MLTFGRLKLTNQYPYQVLIKLFRDYFPSKSFMHEICIFWAIVVILALSNQLEKVQSVDFTANIINSI